MMVIMLVLAVVVGFGMWALGGPQGNWVGDLERSLHENGEI